MGFVMALMPKNTLTLRLALIKFAPLLICLTGTACNEGPKFPNVVSVWETAKNPENGEYLCGEYTPHFTRIEKKVDITFTPKIDHPLKECEGVFGFKLVDMPTVIQWIQDTINYYEEKLSEKK